MLQRRTALALLGSAGFITAGLGAGAPRHAAAAATPSDLPRTDRPEEVGFSAERLGRITAWLSREVEQGRIPGAVVAIGRKGKLAYLEALGYRDREANAPMRHDAVFGIASMTKPITSLALMILAEEGRVQLGHPVAHYLSEFRDQKVGVPRAAADGRTDMALEPVARPVTVQDLLRHTSGLTYDNPGDHPVLRAYREARLRERGIGMAEFIRRLAALPLLHQPGTHWEYSYSTDVVGRIVEVVGGQDLNAFVAQRITGPLGMADTAFFLGDRGRDRVAEPQVDRATGRRPELGFRSPFEPMSWFSGGGGMVGTAVDYARFCQMLLNGGHLDEKRIAARKTIELMTANHLPPGTRFGEYVAAAQRLLAPIPEMGQGFGLGFAVRTEAGRNPAPGSVGDFFWAGAYGSYFWVDPREELYAVLMMQAPNERHEFRPALRQLVYQALV
jgi:CubicO group peptidase (beta-lactamase class C family)